MNAKSAGEQRTESGRIACAGRADCAIPVLLDALDTAEARADRAEAALQRILARYTTPWTPEEAT